MSDKTESEHREPERTEPLPPAAARRRRLATRLGIGGGAVLALFALIFFVLPNPVARYVIESQLQSLGIQHDGLGTLDIDLWNRQVRAGPVTFRAGDAREGQIGETGFDYSFGELFKGRAFVRIFYIRGVDLYVTRLKDGTIEINGVNLRDISAVEEQAATAPPPGEKKESGFGLGGEQFDFSDSKLVFEDLSGGVLTIDLRQLTLNRLRSWTPDEPTTFELEGRLNDIDLKLDGTLVPLGDPLVVTLNTRVEGITLDRVARFVGPIGLARQNGTVDTEVRYDYAFYRDGRIEGTVDGTYNFSAFDVVTATGETMTLDEAILKVDLLQKTLPDGSATAAGQVKLSGGPLALSSTDGAALEVGAVNLSFDNLDFRKGTERRRLLLEPAASAENMETAVRTTPTIVELMIGWAKQLARDALRHSISISGQPILNLRDGVLRVPTTGDGSGQELRFEDLTVDLGKVKSRGFDAGVSMESTLAAVATGLRLASQDGRAQADLSDVKVDSRSINLRATREETTLDFDLDVTLRQLAARDDQGASLDLSGFSLASKSVSIKETADSGTATGTLDLGLSSIAASLPGLEGALTMRGEQLDLNLSPLTLTGKQGESASFAGSFSARGLALERAGDSPLAASLESTHTDLQEVRVAPLGASAVVEGSLATKLSGISLQTGQGPEAVALQLGSLENRMEGLRASGFDDDAPSLSLANWTKLFGLTASLPLGAGHSAEASVDLLEAPLSELAFTDGAVSAKGALEVSGLSATTLEESPQSLDIAGLSVSGLSGNSETGADIERIALGGVIAKLALPLPGLTAAGDGESGTAESRSETPETMAAAEAADGANETALRFDRRFKLGEFTVAPGSRIEVTDRSVEPPLRADVQVEALKLGPLDTGAPEARTDLTLSLSTSETSKVTLQGWAAPLKPKADFELTARVEALSLPPLSPYASSSARFPKSRPKSCRQISACPWVSRSAFSKTARGSSPSACRFRARWTPRRSTTVRRSTRQSPVRWPRSSQRTGSAPTATPSRCSRRPSCPVRRS